MPLSAQDMVDSAKQHITEITPAEIDERLAAGYLVLDVREPNEFDQGHLPNAILIPRGLLEFSIGSHPSFADKSQSILVYCKSGGRGAFATETLQRMGYENVVSLAGGYDAWHSYQG